MGFIKENLYNLELYIMSLHNLKICSQQTAQLNTQIERFPIFDS